MKQAAFFTNLPEHLKPEKVTELPSKDGSDSAKLEKRIEAVAEPVTSTTKPEETNIINGFGELPEQLKPENKQLKELAKKHDIELKPRRKIQNAHAAESSPHNAEMPEPVKKALAEKAKDMAEYPDKPLPEEDDMKHAEYLAKAEEKRRREKKAGIKDPPTEQALHVQALMIEYAEGSLTRRRQAEIQKDIFKHFDQMLDGMSEIYGRKFGKDPDELYVVGKIGLIKAMENFDPKREDAAKFPYYATVSARRYIKATVMKMNGLSTQGERHLFFNIGKYERRLDRFKKVFTVEERDTVIARLLSKRKRKTGKSKGKLIVSSEEHALETLTNFRAKMKKGHTTSLNENLAGDSDNDEIIDTIVDKNALTGEEYIQQKTEKRILADAFEEAMNSLSEKHRIVLKIRMHTRFTENGEERPKFTHQAIADQLGISAEAIRLREKDGQKNFAQEFRKILKDNDVEHLCEENLNIIFGKKVLNDNDNTILDEVQSAEQKDMSEYCALVKTEGKAKSNALNIDYAKPQKKDGGACYQAFTGAKAPIVMERKKKRKLIKPPTNNSTNYAAMAIAAE